jgi:flagellar motor component MotA
MPAGLVMGALFPLGLERARADTLGVWMAADALGTLAGAAVVYLVCLPFGLDALGLGSVAVYVAITITRRA